MKKTTIIKLGRKEIDEALDKYITPYYLKDSNFLYGDGKVIGVQIEATKELEEKE